MNKNKKKIIKIALGVLAGYVLIMTIGYMGVVFYFSSHFQKGTVINGIDCGNKTVEQVKKQLQKQVGKYKLKIEEIDGKTETISAVQIELKYVDDKKVDELLESQDPWKWMADISEDDTYEMEISTSYDKALLGQVLDELSCFQEENIIAPQDAYIRLEDEEYVIVPEVEGTTLDRGRMEKAVEQAIAKGEIRIDLDALDCYEKPEVYRDDAQLNRELEEKNQRLQAETIAEEKQIEFI